MASPSQPSDAKASELKIPKSPVVILMIGFLDASWHTRKFGERYSPKMFKMPKCLKVQIR